MFKQPLILLWTHHPHDLLGDAINFVTHGDAQHAGFLRSDGVTVHECYLPKVRNRPLLEGERPLVRVFRLEGLTEDMATKFETFFDLSVDPRFVQDYSVKGLFGYLFNVEPNDQFSVFCSEYVMQTIRKLEPQLAPLLRCDIWTVSPRDLLISPRLVEISWDDVKNAVSASSSST